MLCPERHRFGAAGGREQSGTKEMMQPISNATLACHLFGAAGRTRAVPMPPPAPRHTARASGHGLAPAKQDRPGS